VVDRAIVAAKVAAIRDAVDRIRRVLPPDASTFEADRTTREVVVLNLFVALQETVSLATHWLADSGMDVPGSYREIFIALPSGGRSPAISRNASRRPRASGTSWPTSTVFSTPPASTPWPRRDSGVFSISAKS